MNIYIQIRIIFNITKLQSNFYLFSFKKFLLFQIKIKYLFFEKNYINIYVGSNLNGGYSYVALPFLIKIMFPN